MIRIPNRTNSKKGNLRKCENHRTLSLICQSSKILLRIILNRLTSKAEEVISEEQAGFRKGRSTTEQIFNYRNLIEKHLKSLKDINHNFIDYKRALGNQIWNSKDIRFKLKYNLYRSLVLSILTYRCES